MIEIRWHGRGGQGAKTGALFLAEAAIGEGKYSQGFPEYGPERMGAPMKGFTRIDDKPIKVHCEVANPQVVIVLDTTLLEAVDVCEGLKEDGVLLVNTPHDPSWIRQKLNISGRKVYTVDASGISIQEIGKAIPNTPMIGAFIRATGLLKPETIYEDIRRKFGKKFDRRITEGNIRAIERAYEEVKGE